MVERRGESGKGVPFGSVVAVVVLAAVERALEALAEGEPERAADVLQRFESVCETVRPVLPAEDHPAACHLHEQPDGAGGTDDGDAAAFDAAGDD